MFKNKKLVDLSHEIFEGMPQWPGKCPFHEKILEKHSDGDVLVTAYDMTGGCGTHMDAPVHFVEGGRSISDYELEDLLNPCVVIDVKEKVAKNDDYGLTAEDVKAWEQVCGDFPDRAFVVANTGWCERWSDPVLFLNKDNDGVMHFPGFDLSAAEYLLEKNISGIGIDTLSLDRGFDRSYPVHCKILGADKFQIEMLANLDQMPANGSYIFVLPTKIKGAPEAQARVIGCL